MASRDESHFGRIQKKVQYLYSAANRICHFGESICASHTGPVYRLGRIPSSHSRTLACSHTATRKIKERQTLWTAECKQITKLIHLNTGKPFTNPAASN